MKCSHLKILNIYECVSPQALTVESMEETVPCPVRHAAASVGLAALAKLVALASKGSLVDLTLGGAAEGHAVVLQLDDGGWSLPGHVVDSVLIMQSMTSRYFIPDNGLT